MNADGDICYIKQCRSYWTHPLAEVELLTRCLTPSSCLSWHVEGRRVGATGINLPPSCFILKRFTKALKICPPKNSTYLQTHSSLAAKCLLIWENVYFPAQSFLCQSHGLELLSWTKDWGHPTLQTCHEGKPWKKSLLGLLFRGVTVSVRLGNECLRWLYQVKVSTTY